MKSSWIAQKPLWASASSFDSVGRGSSVYPWSSVPALEWVPGIRGVFLTILPYHLLQGIQNILLFVKSRLLSHSIFGDKFLTYPNFPIPPYLQSECLNFHPRSMHILEKSLVQKSDNVWPLLQTELLVLWTVLRIFFHEEFSRLQGGLGYFADRNGNPWNLTTTFYPIQIAIIRLTFLLSLFVQLSQQYRSFRIDEVSTYNDSRKDLYRMYQTPMNYDFWLLWRLEELS